MNFLNFKNFINLNSLLFGFIILIAILLRFYQLGNIPPSPNWDEVALGYDAYSLGLTGRDEYGNFLPVVLRSFDDYKPALYAYLAIPSVFIFGLNTFAVRFPSAVFGVIATIATFFLVRTLFEKYSFKDTLALLSSFLMAISPWSIQFSRVGFESNVGGALNILAVLFFIKGLKNNVLLLLSALCAGFSIHVYQSEKVFTPLLMLVLLLIYFKDVIKISKKYLIAAFAIGIIIISPLIFNILTDESTLLRARGTSIFAKQTEILENNIKRLQIDKQNNDFIGYVFDNRRIEYAKMILGGYLIHYDLNWLFIRGDIGRHHAPGMGLLYLYELPFILIGIYILLFGKFQLKTKLTIFLWFLIVPIPASITTEVPHAVRALNFLPTWQIFAALGLIATYIAISNLKYQISNFKLKYVVLIFGILIFIFNFSYYLNQYFVQMNYYNANEWQYGYEEAVSYVKDNQHKYRKVLVSDRRPMDKSYMFFLFYLKYPPAEYQKIGKDSAGGYWAQHKFANYEFRPLNWKQDSQEKGILVLGTENEIPDEAKILKTIFNPDGSVAIKIAEI